MIKQKQFFLSFKLSSNIYLLILLGSIFFTSLILLYNYFVIGIFNTNISQRKLEKYLLFFIFLFGYLTSFCIFIFKSTDVYYFFVFNGLNILITFLLQYKFFKNNFERERIKEFTLFLISKFKIGIILMCYGCIKYLLIYSENFSSTKFSLFSTY